MFTVTLTYTSIQGSELACLQTLGLQCIYVANQYSRIISAVICLNIYLIHPRKAKGRNMMTSVEEEK